MSNALSSIGSDDTKPTLEDACTLCLFALSRNTGNSEDSRGLSRRDREVSVDARTTVHDIAVLLGLIPDDHQLPLLVPLCLGYLQQREWDETNKSRIRVFLELLNEYSCLAVGCPGPRGEMQIPPEGSLREVCRNASQAVRAIKAGENRNSQNNRYNEESDRSSAGGAPSCTDEIAETWLSGVATSSASEAVPYWLQDLPGSSSVVTEAPGELRYAGLCKGDHWTCPCEPACRFELEPGHRNLFADLHLASTGTPISTWNFLRMDDMIWKQLFLRTPMNRCEEDDQTAIQRFFELTRWVILKRHYSGRCTALRGVVQDMSVFVPNPKTRHVTRDVASLYRRVTDIRNRLRF